MRKEWSRLSGLYGIKQVRQTPIHKLRIFVVQGSFLDAGDFFNLRQGASIPCFVGRSVGLSQKCKYPIFQHIISNRYLFHLCGDEKEEEE